MRIGSIGEVRSDFNKKKKSTANTTSTNRTSSDFSKMLDAVENDKSTDNDEQEKNSNSNASDLLNLLR